MWRCRERGPSVPAAPSIDIFTLSVTTSFKRGFFLICLPANRSSLQCLLPNITTRSRVTTTTPHPQVHLPQDRALLTEASRTVRIHSSHSKLTEVSITRAVDIPHKDRLTNKAVIILLPSSSSKVGTILPSSKADILPRAAQSTFSSRSERTITRTACSDVVPLCASAVRSTHCSRLPSKVLRKNRKI